VWATNEGLPERFGSYRVINTPICENGFVDVALGMSLMGLRPVVELMFADFLPTACDAIVNQLAKYRYMSGGKCTVPVTLRVVSGGTWRLGTQHSATGESWFIGQTGIRLAAASTPDAAYGLLRAAIRDNNPVIVHEHRALYGQKGIVNRGKVADVGKAAVMRKGRDVTILGTMLMLDRAIKAADTLAGEGVDAEVIDLRWIRPLDLPTIAASVSKTGRLVVAEEQIHAGGWGATVISELVRAGHTFKAPPQAVSFPAHLLMPYAPPLEDQVLPSAAAIAEGARATLRG
jgi:pyruvate/2-oxoglutarate/acetoin dehydrogenase E1 component